MNNNCVLSLTNVCKKYKQGKSIVEVLKDVDIQADAGELIGIIGASGSGKSTLLHIAGLLDDPGSGKVDICPNDHNIKTLTPEEIRLKHIGFIYQYHHLLKDFSARENIAIPAILSGVNKLDAMDKADELLKRLGLADRRYNMPSELSGGQQQRVAIARAIINTPSIILADEPTGNLDPKTAEEVLELFLELTMEMKTTVLMVTHNIIMVSKMDKVYQIEYGKLMRTR